MSLDPVTRSAASLASRPLGAIAVSLATVLALTAMLGAVFLPYELNQLADRVPVSILDHHSALAGRHAILLTRWKEPGSRGGVRWEVALHSWEGGGSPRVLFPASADPLVATVSKDGGRAFVGRADGRIFAFELEANRQAPLPLEPHREGALSGLCCSDDGQVLVGGGTNGLYAWNTKDRRLRWSRYDLGLVCWALDSTTARLLVDTVDNELLELDLGTGHTMRLIGTNERRATALALSSDGTRVARLGFGGRLEMIDRASGKTVLPVLKPSWQAYHGSRVMAFSPCGRMLITAHATDLRCLLVWNVATGRPFRELHGHDGPVVGFAFAGDGRLQSWGVDGTVRT